MAVSKFCPSGLLLCFVISLRECVLDVRGFSSQSIYDFNLGDHFFFSKIEPLLR